MALPFLPVAGLAAKLYLVGKIGYLVHTAHKKGWDPKRVGKSLVDDIWATLGTSKRSAQAVWYVIQAYEAKSISEAHSVCAKLHTLNYELQQDASLAERYIDQLIDINAYTDSVMRIAYTSAAFTILTKTSIDESDTATNKIEQILFALYLYGRTGYQLDFKERNTVLINFLSTLGSSNTSTSASLEQVLRTFNPRKTTELSDAITSLPEWDSILTRSEDQQTLQSVCYALGMEEIQSPPPVPGATLFHMFQ